MPKSNIALEVTVAGHTERLNDMEDGLKDFSKDMIAAINGLRKDMAERGEKMISMLNDQNTLLTKTQSDQQAALTKNMTDHEAKDIERFADIKATLAYYIGGGAAICALISTIIVGSDIWLRK